ncbi:MAG TPA: papain-like cysteine protease family protein, partial [Candidatus Obscuribacterales bacterium]
EDINTYAQQAGLKARVQRGYNFLFQLEGLLRCLNRGATPIASIQLPGMGSMRHAVLIVGITQHEVTIVDPAKPEIQRVPIDEFQLCWQKEEPGQAGVGLAYIEIWGENARGEVLQTALSWDSIIEELYRDVMGFSEIATNRRDSRFPPAVVQFFDD